MLKKLFLTGSIFLIALLGLAQSSHDVMIGGGVDLLKTDNRALFKKTQLGLEAHYFVVRHFAVGVGTELWTANQKSSFMMGARWYANDNVFLRFRGLIGANDATMGLGYSKAISQNFRLEGMGDFYFGAGNFGLRFGASYILR